MNPCSTSVDRNWGPEKVPLLFYRHKLAGKKTIVYIDGQNFHHGLEQTCGLDSRYINIRKFVEDVLVSHGKQLEAIKYYSAKYPLERNAYKHGRDAAFFTNLEEKQNIRVIEGKFLTPQDLRLPPREKGVDVRLATDLIFDAFLGNYEVAYIISSDTDLVPAIKQIKENGNFKGIVINNFSFNKLNDFINTCDYVGLIFPNKIKKYYDPSWFSVSQGSIKALLDKHRKK